MKKLIYIIVVITIFGCSEDKDTLIKEEVSTAKKETKNRIKGEIPRNMNVYSVLSKSGNKSVFELLELYKEDIKRAKDEDYETNLKNMWLISLNTKVLNSGTSDEKHYLIQEQDKMENNLPHINNYYKLLTVTNSIDKAEKMLKARSFYEKNKIAINNINWHTAEEKNQKETELVIAFRNFGIQQQFSK